MVLSDRGETRFIRVTTGLSVPMEPKPRHSIVACLRTPDRDSIDSMVSNLGRHRAQTGFSHQYETLPITPTFISLAIVLCMVSRISVARLGGKSDPQG